MNERKCYRVLVNKTPKNSSSDYAYNYEEDVYASSEKDAMASIAEYYKTDGGKVIPVNAQEIAKNEFRGNHKVKISQKYYRVLVHRIPPYSFVNGSYHYEEDVRSRSAGHAMDNVAMYHRKGYGRNIPVKAWEITKEEFRGSHGTGDHEPD